MHSISCMATFKNDPPPRWKEPPLLSTWWARTGTQVCVWMDTTLMGFIQDFVEGGLQRGSWRPGGLVQQPQCTKPEATLGPPLTSWWLLLEWIQLMVPSWWQLDNQHIQNHTFVLHHTTFKQSPQATIKHVPQSIYGVCKINKHVFAIKSRTLGSRVPSKPKNKGNMRRLVNRVLLGTLKCHYV